MADDCIDRLMDEELQKKLFGDRKMPKELVKRFVDLIESAKQTKDSIGFEKRVSQYIQETRKLNEVEKAKKAMNIRKAKERMDYYDQVAFRKDPAEGFKAILTESKFLADSGRDSIQHRGAAISGKYKNYLHAKLNEMKNLKLFASGQIDKEIMTELGHLYEGKNMGSTKNPDAVGIAKTLFEMNNMGLRDQQAAGASVKFDPKYWAPQTHNPSSIRDAGFKTWADTILPRLDHEATFGKHAGDSKKIMEILGREYKKAKAGFAGVDTVIGGDDVEDMLKGTAYTRSFDTKLSSSRFFRFKNPVAAYEYNAKFGTGNLMETYLTDIDRTSKMVGAMQKFGSNPEASIQADMDRMMAKFKKNGELEKADRLMRERKGIVDLFNQVMGKNNMPGQNEIAKIGSAIRTSMVLSKMMFSGIRSMGNVVPTMMALKTNTGENLLQVAHKTVSSWVDSLPKSGRQEISREAGFFLDDWHSNFIDSAIGTTNEYGLASRTATQMLKMNGLKFFTDSARTAYARSMMRAIANNANTEFKKLDPVFQGSLRTAGIQAHDWEFMKLAVKDTPKGYKLATPEALLELDPKMKEVRIAAANARMSPENYLADLQTKYSAFIIQGADVASTSAGGRVLNIMHGGHMAGTGWGEIRRLLFQFKSFGIQQHFIVQQLLNSKPDERALIHGNLISGKKDWMSFGQLVVMSAAMGYVTQGIIDTVNGKGIKDPRNPDTWWDALQKGGAGGLYADFLFGEWDNMWISPSESVLGPTFGQVFGTGARVVARSRNYYLGGDEKQGDKLVKETTRLVRNNIPFQQLPLMKQALDYLQNDVIQESLTPGYKARSDLNKWRDEQKRLQIFDGGEEK